jgi:hypothetical protein
MEITQCIELFAKMWWPAWAAVGGFAALVYISAKFGN